MANRGKTLIFWIISVVLFMMPFLFYRNSHLSNQGRKTITILANNVSSEIDSSITVHVEGAVVNPGIYKVKIGTKLYELLEIIELNKNASIAHLNLAKTCRDGQKIMVKEKQRKTTAVNINLATSKELQAVSGIGPATATKIINYRIKNGSFSSIKELLSIKGISQNKLSKIERFLKI